MMIEISYFMFDMEAFRIRDTSYAILFTLVGAFLVTQPPCIFDSAKSTWRNFVGDILLYD
eukprot:UN05652